jgi:hypothetical protein
MIILTKVHEQARIRQKFITNGMGSFPYRCMHEFLSTLNLVAKNVKNKGKKNFSYSLFSSARIFIFPKKHKQLWIWLHFLMSLHGMKWCKLVFEFMKKTTFALSI